MRRQFTSLILGIGILAFCSSIFAQTTMPTSYNPENKISRAQLQKDLLAFRKCLEEAQASLYRYADKKIMDRRFDAAFAAINRDMTEREYYQILTQILSKIGDGHGAAFLTRDFRNYINQSAKLFPLKLRFISGKAYVLTSPLQTVPTGLEIRAVNGRPMSKIIQQLFVHLTSDGAIESGKFWKLNGQFGLYYYLFIEQPAKFRLDCYDQTTKARKTIEVPAMTQSEQKERINEKAGTTSKVDKKPLRFELLALPNTALLTIETFDDGAMEKAGQNFSQFLKTTFQELAEKKIQDLIIDLRGNDGGANLGPVLFSYLTDKEFRFVDRIEASTDKPSFILNYTQLSADFLKGFASSLMSDNKGRYKIKVESEPTLAPQKPQADAYRNRVWFIINGETFSSTAMFCDIARSQRRGSFVGEETGGDYFGNSAGEFVVITLPETKIKVIVALEEYWMAVSAVPKLGRGVIPDYPAQPNIKDILEGKDTELNYTLGLIEKKRQRKRI